MADNKPTCSVLDCDASAIAKSYCGKHYARWKRTGDPEGTRRKFKPKPPCIVDGCQNDGNTHGFGWCEKHYRRYQRHGSPLATSRIVGDNIARFWSYVEDASDRSRCWEWTGGLSKDGYGILLINKATTYMPRFAYELLIGPIGEGLEPDHLCRNRGCVNPWHLEPVTHKVNILRGESPQAINARKTHCPKGHEYSPENTRRQRRGGRLCKACQAEHSRKRQARRKSA